MQSKKGYDVCVWRVEAASPWMVPRRNGKETPQAGAALETQEFMLPVVHGGTAICRGGFAHASRGRCWMLKKH